MDVFEADPTSETVNTPPVYVTGDDQEMIDIPPELAEGILEKLNQNPLLKANAAPTSMSSVSSALPFAPSSSPSAHYFAKFASLQSPLYPSPPNPLSSSSGFSKNAMDVVPSDEGGSSSKRSKKRAMFDVARLYGQAQWVDDVHFTLVEMDWDFKTMNNWGFFCNTSLGKGIWYYIWVIPGQGPIFRRGNLTEAVQLINQQGEPSRPNAQTRLLNGRPRLRLLEWRQKCGIGHLDVKGSSVRYVGTKKRQRLEQADDDDEMDEQAAALLGISQVFDLVGYAYSSNRVTIIGSGFSDGPTAVLFGSEAAAAEINFVSDKGDVIVCLTPHCPPGKVWIEVVNGRGKTRFEVQQYEFVEDKTKGRSTVALPAVVKQEETDDPMQYSYQGDDLFTSSAFGDNDLLSELIDTSVPNSINMSDDLGATALFWAVFSRHLDTATLLLSKGADPNLATLAYEFPLHLAADNGDVEMIKLLIDYGASVNVKNADGESPLFYGSHDARVVHCLLDNGADVTGRNKRGESFRDWASTAPELNTQIRNAARKKILERKEKVTLAKPSSLDSMSSSPKQKDSIPAAKSLAILSEILDEHASEFVPELGKPQYLKPKPPSRRPPTSIATADRLSDERSVLVAQQRLSAPDDPTTSSHVFF